VFTKTAKHYDAVYSHKDYESESKFITSLIRERVPNATTLLDVACGTGKHLEQLSKEFECTGIDLDPEMLAIAVERVPVVQLHSGDMCEFDLNAKFDAVTCLFSSIGYTRTVERMQMAISNMANHLNTGGILLVEPWIAPEDWLVGKTHSDTYETEEFIVTRMMVAEPVERGRVVFEYLIGDSSGISRVSETHEMGWFTHDEYKNAFKKAELELEFIDEGLTNRGIYIGKKF
jgi:ubiquinone/menaquinone biosynthesis C-methylase UbiE